MRKTCTVLSVVITQLKASHSQLLGRNTSKKAWTVLNVVITIFHSWAFMDLAAF